MQAQISIDSINSVSLPVLPHQLTANVTLLQKIAMIDQGQCLFLKRSTDSYSRPGQWDWPGGNSEWPTTQTLITDIHFEDLSRELREETGWLISADLLRLWARLLQLATVFEPNKQRYSVIVGWIINLDEIAQLIENWQRDSAGLLKPKLSGEHLDYAWLNQQTLEKELSVGEAGSTNGRHFPTGVSFMDNFAKQALLVLQKQTKMEEK